VLPPLLQCRKLHNLALGDGIAVSRTHLQAFLQGLPLLRTLGLEYMLLESVAPLAYASNLEKSVV